MAEQEPQVLNEPPQNGESDRDTPKFSQRQMDSACANVRRDLQSENKTLKQQLAELHGGGKEQPGEPQQPKEDEPPPWAAKLMERLDAIEKGAGAGGGQPSTAAAAAATPAPAPPEQPAQPPTLKQLLGAVQQAKAAGAVATYPVDGSGISQHPPAPPSISAPSTVDQLERGDIHPNRLTADQIQRLGPEGVYKYAKNYFHQKGKAPY